MNDSYGRTIDYLRVSVTDRCNEHCLYCMPEGYRGWAQKEDHLTKDELLRIVEAAVRLGFRKFRITGGEPLIRRDIIEILERIWMLPGVEALGLSTNGSRLSALAPAIKRAGVRSINISLDALDPAIYHRITGGNLQTVLDGIEAARLQNFEVIKLNCVLMRGVNESEIEPLIHYAAERGMPLRFIELMPVSQADVLHDPAFLSVSELMSRLQTTGTLIPLPDYQIGHGPAKYYNYHASGLPEPAKLGFIGALTTPHFCETCNKLRLTADGKLRPCLGRVGEIDLLAALRLGEDTLQHLQMAIANKPENHEFADDYEPNRPMTAIGG